MKYSSDEAREYLSKVGKRGLRHLATIEALSPFVEAMQTELGAEFLKDDIEEHSLLINKIYGELINEGKADQKDVIELKIRHDRLRKIYDRLKTYDVGTKLVKKIASE